jgi:hypothetical protein
MALAASSGRFGAGKADRSPRQGEGADAVSISGHARSDGRSSAQIANLVLDANRRGGRSTARDHVIRPALKRHRYLTSPPALCRPFRAELEQLVVLQSPRRLVREQAR